MPAHRRPPHQGSRHALSDGRSPPIWAGSCPSPAMFRLKVGRKVAIFLPRPSCPPSFPEECQAGGGGPGRGRTVRPWPARFSSRLRCRGHRNVRGSTWCVRVRWGKGSGKGGGVWACGALPGTQKSKICHALQCPVLPTMFMGHLNQRESGARRCSRKG